MTPPRAVAIPLAVLVAIVFPLQGCIHDDEEPQATDTIVIPGPWVFEPQVALVAPGETMTWRNDGNHAHTVTFSQYDGIDLDVTLRPWEETEHTFEQEGTYEYACTFHLPDMVGTVVVANG